MPLTVEKQIDLEHAIEVCSMNEDALSNWERKFMSDIAERYEDEGAKLFLSGAQWKYINMACRKAGGQERRDDE